MSGGLQLPFEDIYISSLTLSVANQDPSTGMLMKLQANCTRDTEALNWIVEKVRKGKQFAYTCDDHLWRSFPCSGALVFCVDCEKDCSKCPGQSQSFLTRPCSLDFCEGSTAVEEHFSIVSFGVSRTILYPEFTEPISLTSVWQNSTTVSMRVNRPGSLFCLALVESLPLVSTAMIKKLGIRSQLLTNASEPGTASRHSIQLSLMSRVTFFVYHSQSRNR